jgi:hypothetical protein
MMSLGVMKAVVVAAALLALTASASTSTAVDKRPQKTSWADARHLHGWAVERRDATVCAAKRFRPAIRHYKLSAICATENGGKSWRPILYTTRTVIPSLVRTSLGAGIVVAGYWKRQNYWTRDDGKHWYRTTVVQPPGFFFSPTFEQTTNGLYFRAYSSNGRLGEEIHTATFRLNGWPPKGALDCESRQVCDADMKAVRVGTATFDATDGTGLLSGADARLATGWTAGQLDERASQVSFAAEIDVVWDTTCAADDGSASSQNSVGGRRRVVVKSSQADGGFAFSGYGVVIDEASFDPPPPGARCQVNVTPYPAGHITAVEKSTRSVTWLYLRFGNFQFDVGNYPY